MPAPLFSAADYLGAMQSLLPRGRVWPRELDSTQASILSALVQVYQRSNARANQLLVDAFPANSTELLPEWESTFGLPSLCTGPLQTLQARRAAVVSGFSNSGGQSATYFIGQAAKLGYAVTVTNYSPFRVGQNHVGQSVGIVDWAFTWSINAPLNTVTPFRVGQSAVDEPLNSWGNQLLVCELSAIMPAHSILQFHYQ